MTTSRRAYRHREIDVPFRADAVSAEDPAATTRRRALLRPGMRA